MESAAVGNTIAIRRRRADAASAQITKHAGRAATGAGAEDVVYRTRGSCGGGVAVARVLAGRDGLLHPRITP
ncbi:hypothetical protein E2C01_064022 [Portunus trituberculatus]|uniref:Uncharacterized protein n=1 Tax=Portunus trituberculatus TaxID=210409 RepID=A0A5B7HAN6_PORTR|nr:hypothetical protein [Portunus trituberculatus]